MKSEKRISTLLVFFILLLSMGGGVFLIERSRYKFFAGANSEISPKQVRITNVEDKSFSVSWITDVQTTGFVQYGEEGSFSLTSPDDRDQLSGEQGKFWVHHVTVRNLNPKTKYFFKINSGGETFDDNGQPYQIETAPPIQGIPVSNDIAYGSVVKEDGSPAGGVVVYVSLINTAPLSTLTKSSGAWAIPLNLSRSSDLSSFAAYDKEASVEEIFFQGGPAGVSSVITVTKNDSPLPLVTLGKNFDFRQFLAQALPTSTPTPIPTPTFIYTLTPTPVFQETASSRFLIKDEGNIVSSKNDLKIINPSQGEMVNTSKPEILGTGPPGEVLTITVNSPETLSAQVTIDERGNWLWVPPRELSPGEHTIMANLANGQKVVRSFTILAAGLSDLPSFTASPSSIATDSSLLIATLTPTMMPLSGDNERVSLPASGPGVLNSGNLTPTVFFLILGIVGVILGILIRYLPMEHNFYG